MTRCNKGKNSQEALVTFIHSEVRSWMFLATKWVNVIIYSSLQLQFLYCSEKGRLFEGKLVIKFRKVSSTSFISPFIYLQKESKPVEKFSQCKIKFENDTKRCKIVFEIFFLLQFHLEKKISKLKLPIIFLQWLRLDEAVKMTRSC